ncbi:MAG: DUF2497 domain-containing protein [Alphaproteobacteria bacterium]
MTAEAETQQTEPTMEEILASIRQIIASDKDGAPPQAANSDDILDLTEVVEEPQPEPLPDPEPAPPPMEEPSVEENAMTEPDPVPEIQKLPAEDPPPAQTAEPLISEPSASASASAFADFAQHLQNEKLSLPANLYVGDGQQTLEGLVAGIMRPLLKEWLDQNLPATVERLVQRELDRIARFHRD